MNFFEQLKNKRNDSPELVSCVTKTVDELLSRETSVKKPGMLLGKIQSGKTRAFIGIIAHGFDRGYDMVIVLTKGTKALAKQTYERLIDDFDEPVRSDELQIHDIMHFPQNLTPYELRQKLIIVVKKESNNMQRVISALAETYPDLSYKKLLIIDDEADFASISFRKNKEEGKIELGKIAQQIDELRTKVSASDFLQVTATPYSLYLQPDDVDLNPSDPTFKPMRPAFTVLVPIHDSYVGGDYYFLDSDDKTSTAHKVFEEVTPRETTVLKSEDKRAFKLEDALVAKGIETLRNGIINFMVGGAVRRIQQKKLNEKLEKYSFIVHTESSRNSHLWQEEIVMEIKNQLVKAVNGNQFLFDSLLRKAFDDIGKSVNLADLLLPEYVEVKKEVEQVLLDGYLMITVVNSEKQIEELLDEKGQLKLRTPFNIFIGGQILDRGITINNLIGFFYGRSPKKFQQDTVLQHSRMYGARSKADLAVTRFYTTLEIYQIMKKIHEFDSALRVAFERGSQDNGVVFLRRDDDNRLLPCSPNKILMSSTTTLKPHKRMLPVGFQTDYKKNLKEKIVFLDKLISQYGVSEGAVIVDMQIVKQILGTIKDTLIFEDGYEWDYNSFLSSVEYSSKNTNKIELSGKVACIIKKDRNLSRLRDSDMAFSDSPDTKQETALAREHGEDLPVLMLFRQNGNEDQGWRGSPFWWPVLIIPRNIKTVVFTSNVLEG